MIGLISNRSSGHNRDHFAQLSRQIEQQPNIEHRVTNSTEEIPGVLAHFAAESIDTLAINGGDGTVSAVLGCALENKLFPTIPTVVVLPGGTANMNAGDIGVRGNLKQAVTKFCHWSKTQTGDHERVQRSLMRVDFGAGIFHYGMFLGAGVVMHGTEYAHREIHSRGLRDDFSVGLGAARTVWGIIRSEPEFTHPVDIDLEVPSLSYSAEHSVRILAISTLGKLFMGIRPFWGKQAGSLQLSVIDSDCHKFLRTFTSIAHGKPNKYATPEHGYRSMNSDLIKIHMDGSLNLDGEILTSSRQQGPVTISGSKQISFIRL